MTTKEEQNHLFLREKLPQIQMVKINKILTKYDTFQALVCYYLLQQKKTIDNILK